MICITPDAVTESDPGHFVTEASTVGLAPGDFPLYVRFDGDVFSRFALNQESAQYCGTNHVLVIFND